MNETRHHSLTRLTAACETGLASAETLAEFADTLHAAFAHHPRFHSVRLSLSPLDALNTKLEADTLLSDHSVDYRLRRHHTDPTPVWLIKHQGSRHGDWRGHRRGVPMAIDFEDRYMRSEGWADYHELYFWKLGSYQGNICIRTCEPTKIAMDDLRAVRNRVRPHFFRLRDRLEVQLERRFYLDLVNRMPVGVVVLDSKGQFHFANAEGRSHLHRWNVGDDATWLKAPAEPIVPDEIREHCRRLPCGNASADIDPLPSPSRSIESLRGVRADVQRVDRASELIGNGFYLVWLTLTQASVTIGSQAVGVSTGLAAALTCQERQVARMAASGLRNAEIAEQLGKSLSTVRSQLHSVFQKLNIRSRIDLIHLGFT